MAGFHALPIGTVRLQPKEGHGSDCNLAKCCDYVQAEEYEQDCYINAEPCGDCLRCQGVFQCLR